MEKLIRQKSKVKAIDHAIWFNFTNRVSGKTVGVIESMEGDYIITSLAHPSFKGESFEPFPSDYSDMTYKHIASIGMDENPLKHWEEIRGMVSVMGGEILRFILAKKVPIDKLIRYELACRGYDKNHQWCDFEKAKKIWLE